MKQLGLPTSTINIIVDNPTLLGDHPNRQSSADSADDLRSLGISDQAATHILNGYNNGFRAVFIMNASLAAVATIVSVLMIRHKELTREDEAQLRAEAKKGASSHAGKQDIEMAEVNTNMDTPELDSKR